MKLSFIRITFLPISHLSNLQSKQSVQNRFKRSVKTVLNGLYRVDVDVYRHLVDSVLGIKQTLV